jgi:hypothetical protein
MHVDPVVVGHLHRDGDAVPDGEWQAEAPVVVGVLSDQVDSAGAEGAGRRHEPWRGPAERGACGIPAGLGS